MHEKPSPLGITRQMLYLPLANYTATKEHDNWIQASTFDCLVYSVWFSVYTMALPSLTIFFGILHVVIHEWTSNIKYISLQRNTTRNQAAVPWRDM